MMASLRKTARRAIFFWMLSLFLCPYLTPASAQTEPPLEPPKLRSLGLPENAIPYYGWALYPTLDASAIFDSNLYQSPNAPISAWGFLINPSLVAEHTNGIHTTRLYGDIQSKIYPTVSDNNTLDRQAGIIQRYEAMRDLIFTFHGDYTHREIATLFQNAIPGPVIGPANLPQNVSETVQALGTVVKNPYDQYTGTATVHKIFNRAFVQFGVSFAHTSYDNQALTPDFSVATYSGSGAVWLVPAAFLYASGSYAEYFNTDERAHTVQVGLGTPKIGLYRASIYIGHQGTEVNSGTAGGLIYGGRLTYYATHRLTLAATVDEIVNDSSQTTTTLSVTPASVLTVVSVPTSSSTRTTATALRGDYVVTKLVTAYGVFGYTWIDYVNGIERDNSWLAAAGLKYNIWPNMALTLDYRHAQLDSNVPNVSFTRDYVGVGAHYEFRPL